MGKHTVSAMDEALGESLLLPGPDTDVRVSYVFLDFAGKTESLRADSNCLPLLITS